MATDLAPRKRKTKPPAKPVENGWDDLIPPGATSTTTPAGIRRHDPQALPDFAGDRPDQAITQSEPDPTAEAIRLAIRDLAANRFNARKTFDEAGLDELAASLKQHGQVQPIVVRKLPRGAGLASIAEPSCQATYEIAAGERRVLAAMRAGWQKIRAEVREFSDEQMRELALVENDLRVDLSDLERARQYRELIDGHGWTVTRLAERLGKSQPYVSNLLRLLELPKNWQDRVLSREMPSTHARYVLPYKDVPAVMQQLDKRWKGLLEDEEGSPSIKEWTRVIWSTLHYHTAELERHVWSDADYSSGTVKIQLTPELRKELRVVELPDGDERALNKKAAKKLLDQKAEEWKKAKQAKKKNGAAAGKGKPADPKKAAAEEKAKAASLAKRRKEALGRWRHAWLRRLVAEMFMEPAAAPDVECKLVMYWLVDGCPMGHRGVGNLVLGRLGAKPSDAYGSTALAKSLLALDERTAYKAVRDVISAWLTDERVGLPDELVGGGLGVGKQRRAKSSLTRGPPLD